MRPAVLQSLVLEVPVNKNDIGGNLNCFIYSALYRVFLTAVGWYTNSWNPEYTHKMLSSFTVAIIKYFRHSFSNDNRNVVLLHNHRQSSAIIRNMTYELEI